jgi:hypothetical protein
MRRLIEYFVKEIGAKINQLKILGLTKKLLLK